MTSRLRTLVVAAAWTIGAMAGLLLLAGYIRTTPDYDAAGDGASLALRTIEVIRTRQFVGPYSQFGWNHPGPLLFYLMAPLYALTHYNEMALRWTALLINLLSFGGILIVTRRSPWLMVTTAAGLVLYLTRAGGDLLFSAWNPHVTLLPLALFVFLLADIALGRFQRLPLAAFVGSLAAQSNLGFVPLVGVLFAVSLIACWRAVATSAPADRPRLRSTINATAWLLLLLWGLPLAEEIVHNPNGNVDRIIGFFQEQDGHLPLRQALGLFGYYGLGPFGPKFMLPLGWDAPTEFAIWQPLPAFALLLVTAAGTWLALRRRQEFTAAVGSLCLLGSLLGIVLVYGIPTKVSDHQVFWVSLFVLLGLSAAGSAAAETWLRAGVTATRVTSIAAVALVAGLFVVTVSQMGPWQIGVSQDRTLRDMYGQFNEYLLTINSRAPEIRHTGSTWHTTVGLVLQFAKHHQSIRIDDDLVHIAGERYRVKDTTTESYLLFDAERDKVKLRPNPRMLIHVGSLTLVNTRDVEPQ